jgi:hypothetical protein
MVSAFSAREAPEGARDLVVAAHGSDGRGHFARYRLPAGSDVTPPITMQHNPAADLGNGVSGEPIFFRIADDRSGVDRSSLRVYINGKLADATVRGVPRNLLVQAPVIAPIDSLVTIRIEAADLSEPPNNMAPFEYSFTILAPRGEPFRRGDANADAGMDLSDAIFTLLYLFADGTEPPCTRSADANDDGTLDTADAVYTLSFLFAGGPHPPAPYRACGFDTTPDAITCDAFPPCE